MATASEASLGLWRDYSRRYLDQRQILATDFWSQWMTAFVAVCLTLTSPYVFKIAKSFLVWLIALLSWLTTKWKNTRSAEPSSSSSSVTESQTLLRQSRHIDYGSGKKPENGSISPDVQRPNGKPVNPVESEYNNQPHNVKSVSENQSPQTVATLPAAESSSDSERPTSSVHGNEGPAKILENSPDSRETVWRFVESLLHHGAKEANSPSTTMIVIATVLFGLFVAQAIAGVFSAKIASDRTGLSSSQHCGIWQFDENAGGEAADRDDLNNYQKEARASQYARTCYNSPDPTDPFSCRVFYNQSIAYTTKTSQTCPFASSELCHDGLYSAISFDTGYVDASVIGINSPTTYKFRRTTSCSPLNMSEPYVLPSSQGVNDTAYHYYFGPKDNTEYTFNTSGRPFEWLVPVYSVSTYFSSLYPGSDYWQPIPELKPPANSTLTIIFVSSMHIYHVKPSFDPIFPANEPRYFEGFREPYYYNADARARALACVDTSELCPPDGTTCWSMTSPLPPDIGSSPDYWLMKWSLENSNTYDSIKWRLGTALLAQESVSQSVSNPLSPHQWQLEANQLFATSLARIQYDAWKIATGEDRERPGYVEVTPDEAKGHLCRLYKSKTSDYTNINLAAFVGLPLLAITIFILSWDASVVGLDSKNNEENASEPLIIDVIVRFICYILLALTVGIYHGISTLFREGIHWIKDRRPDSNPS